MTRLRRLLASTPARVALAIVIGAACLVASEAERGETITASLVVICIALCLVWIAFEGALYAIVGSAVRWARGGPNARR